MRTKFHPRMVVATLKVVEAMEAEAERITGALLQRIKGL